MEVEIVKQTNHNYCPPKQRNRKQIGGKHVKLPNDFFGQKTVESPPNQPQFKNRMEKPKSEFSGLSKKEYLKKKAEEKKNAVKLIEKIKPPEVCFLGGDSFYEEKKSILSKIAQNDDDRLQKEFVLFFSFIFSFPS